MASLKAYELRYLDGDEEPCAIVYAVDRKGARAQFRTIDRATYIATECHRRPELDAYAPNGPTASDLLRKHDWWFACRACGEQVRIESHPDAVVTGEARDAARVYCNPDCAAKAP